MSFSPFTQSPTALTDLVVGQRICLCQDVDRSPEFLAPTGRTRAIEELLQLQQGYLVSVLMDGPLLGDPQQLSQTDSSMILRSMGWLYRRRNRHRGGGADGHRDCCTVGGGTAASALTRQ